MAPVPPDLAPVVIGDPDLGPIITDCLEGDWTIASTSMGQPGGVVRITTSQIFVWAPGAPPPSAPVGVAQYHLAYGGSPWPRIALDSSTGLGCDDNATFRQTDSSDCSEIELTAEIDNCTGAREYLDGQVILQR
jgi:hypothetical protein